MYPSLQYRDHTTDKCAMHKGYVYNIQTQTEFVIQSLEMRAGPMEPHHHIN